MDDLFPQQAPDQCRVCNEPVVDGRWNYCSERCRDIAQAVQKMFIWDTVREQVLERDDYTCQECGLSRELWKRAYWQVQEIAADRAEELRDAEGGTWRTKKQTLIERYDVEFPEFHVDHIQRVADGGHPLDEENLQTLCKHCHEAKTASENREESIEQRPEAGLDEYL